MILAVQSILSISIIIILGYILTSKNWFTEATSDTLVKLVTQVSLPVLMLNNIVSNFDKEKLLGSFSGLIVPFSSIALCYIIAIAISKIIKVEKKHLGLFKSMFFNSNTIFMGLPINIALFGEKSVPYVLLYYIANTTFFWTIGVYEISKDGTASNGSLFSKETLKKVVSAPLIGYVIGVVLVILNTKLPKFMIDTFTYLGSLATPIAMIFIGITIHSIKLKDIKFDRHAIGILLGRFIISPILVILLSYIFPIPSLMRNVFIIQAAMPVMTNTAIIAKSYEADHEYAAIMIAITTIATLFVVPIYAATMH